MYNLFKAEIYLLFNKKGSILLVSQTLLLYCVSRKYKRCHWECVAKMCTTLECACQHPIWKMCHRQNLCQNALYNKGWYDQNRAAKLFFPIISCFPWYSSNELFITDRERESEKKNKRSQWILIGNPSYCLQMNYFWNVSCLFNTTYFSRWGEVELWLHWGSVKWAKPSCKEPKVS